MSEADERSNEVVRLIAFSDGVFAFAITLLVITIPYPTLSSSIGVWPFLHKLFALKYAFYSYAVSFYIIGFYWFSHREYFRYIVRFDTGLFFINLTLLLLVAFVPFSTKLEGTYGTSPVVTAFYGANLALINALYQLLWAYASAGHRLVRPTLEPRVMAYIRLRGLLRLGLFVSSIGLAFIAPFLAEAAWVATFVVPVVLRRHGSPHGREQGSNARKGR